MNLLPASPGGGDRRRLGRLLVVAVALAIVIGLANQGLFSPGEGRGTPLAPSLAMAAAGGKPEAWGNNNFGQIGDGTHDNRDWPQNG